MRKIYGLLLALLVFTAQQGLGQGNLVISQYIETNSGSTPKGIEVWNVSGGDIDFSVTPFEVFKGTNGAATSNDFTLNTGVLGAGEVMVIGTTDMGTYLTNEGLTSVIFGDEGFTFNGDDALEIYLDGTLEDVFGTVGVDPGSAWSGNGVSTANQNIQLLEGITTGDTDGWSDPSTRFETVSTDPVNDLSGFGIAPPAPCTAPTTQATFGGTTSIGDNDLTLNWTRGDGDGGVLILAKEGAAVDAEPASGSSYTANSTFGSGDEIGAGNFVVYNGTGTSETLSSLTLGTDYHFAIFEYNSTDVCYLTTAETLTETTTGNALPVLSSAGTASAETTNDIVLTFSENVTGTDETGISVSIDGSAATINSVAGNGSSEWTLTLAEEIRKNTGAILVSYDDTSGDLADDDAAALASFTDVAVTNNTTLNVVADLEAARAFADGELVEATADVTVSYVRNSGNTLYAQDATRGIIIQDDNSNLTTSYNAGDVIGGVKGTINVDFTGVIEIIPVADLGAATSTGATITPDVVTITDFNTNFANYESRVVTIEEVTFANPGSEFDDGGDNYDISNSGNTTVFRDNFTEVRYESGTFIPYGRIDITALGGQFQGSAQIVPFSLTEAFADNYAPEFSTAPSAGTPTTSAFDVTFRLDEPGTVYYLVDETTNSTPDVASVLASSDSETYTDPTADGTISLSGLNDNTEYFVHIVAVDDEGTPNEQSSVTTVSATTLEVVFDATSDIVAANSPIGAATISSLANADTDATDVFNFKVTDDNATDTEPTAINTIVIENNNAATWSSIIEGASITDGTTANTATSITDTEITFDLSGSQYFVTGGTEITFTLSVWLNATQTDETELQFTIPTDHPFEADASGSVIKATLDAAVTSALHTVEVEATTFATTVPERTKPNTDFSVSVIAEDANGNTDVAPRTIDIDATAGNKGASGTLSSATGITGQAMVDGEFTFTDLQYDQVEDIRLTVTDGTISTNTLFFAVSDTQVETFDNFPETGSSYVDGSFTGEDGSTWTYFQARGDQTIDGATPMLGRGRTPDAEMTSGTISGGIEKLSFDYSQAFSTNVELEVYVNGDSITTVTSDNEAGITKNSGEILLEIEGDFTLSFKNPNGGQVNIDNVTWNGYEAVCAAPSTQASALNAVVVDNNTIDLDWTNGNGDATLILAKANGAVDADPELVTAYTADASFGSGDEIGTGNFVVYAGSDASTQITGLTQGTEYHFAAYTYNTAENCYLLDSPAVANVTTTSDNDADSDITTADSPIGVSNVSSLANAEADAVDVFNFKIVDSGATDGEPTIVNKIAISAGSANMANWTEALSGASISIGTFSASNATITENAIEFDLAENLLTVNDGADSTVTLSVWLSETVTDGDTLVFEIPASHNFTASGDGSLFSATVSGAISAKHLIDVSATTLTVDAPSSAVEGNNFEVTVSAEDANGNVDTADRTVTISADGSGALSGTTELALTDGTVTFTGLSYSEVASITLTATDGTINGTANINIAEQPTEITETFDNFDYTGGSYTDGEFLGQDGSTWTYAQARGDVNIDGPSPMLGRNRTPDAFVESGTISGGIGTLNFDYAQAFSTDVSLEVYVNDNLITTVTSEGQQNETLNSGDITVEVPGDFVLKFFNPNGGQVNIDNVKWSSFASTNPTIAVNLSDFEGDFGEVEVDANSANSAFVLEAQNLEADVTLAVPAGFEVSFAADFATLGDSENPLSITPEDGSIDTTVYVRFAPKATGSFSGDIVLTSTNATERKVSVSGIAVPAGIELIFAENFDNCEALNEFTAFSIIGDQEWACSSDGFEGSSVRMNGFSSGAQDNEDWLISPAVDLSNYTYAEFDFYSNQNFSGGDFKVFISEDYEAGQDPSGESFNWVEITDVELSASGWEFSGPADISNYLSSSVHIAFVYYSDTEGAAEWFVDNFRVRGILSDDAPNIVLDDSNFESDFGRVVSGQSSEIRSYSLSAENLTANVNITVPEGFRISLTEDFSANVGDFETNLSIAPTEGAITDTTIYVQFVPGEIEAKVYSGNIAHSSADATTRNIAVSGQEGQEGGIISIATARGLNADTEVRITGVVIGGPNNESANRIIYDATGGIVIRETQAEGLLTENLNIGDSVVVTGSLGAFNQLIQVSSLTELQVVANGASLPSFETATIADITANYESYASSFVRIEGVTFTDERTTFVGGGGDGNFSIEDASGEMTFRIGSGDHPLVGQEVPAEAVTVQGYIGRFNDAIQIFVNDENGILEAEVEPSLTVDLESIDFGTVDVGESSEAESITVQGTNLDNNIALFVEGDFEISLSSDADFAKEVNLDLDQAGDFFGEVFVRFVPTEQGTKTAELTINSGEFNLLVGLSGEGQEVVTSVNEKMLQGVTYYPNPALDILNISLSKEGGFDYEVISLQGAQIIEGRADGETEVSLGNLETGVYILKVNQAGKQFNTRFIKQ